MRIDELDIAVFDFETTGLKHAEDKIIEMAAIKIRKGIVVAEFSCLIKQEQPLPAKITELTGITDADLENGFEEKTAFKMLYQMLEGSIIVAHNACFDLQFLHHGMQRVSEGRRQVDYDFIDTLTIARDRDVFPYKLPVLCERYGIDMGTAHRAYADVYGCYHLLQYLEKQAPIDEWLNKLSYMNKYGPEKWYPPHAIVFGADNRYK